MLVEIQALVAPFSMAHPRRNKLGYGASVDARCRPRSPRRHSAFDIFLNVAGGVKISEPAADLAVAAALISSVTGRPCPRNTVIFGEVWPRRRSPPRSHPEQRRKEAAKLGFEQVIMPPIKAKGLDLSGMGAHAVDSLNALIESLGGRDNGYDTLSLTRE